MNGYKVIRSSRRSISIEVGIFGQVLVRAPFAVSDTELEAFVVKQSGWIEKAQENQKLRRQRHPEPTKEEAEALRQKAREILPGRVEYFSSLTGLVPSSVKVTSAKTRFGSCSGKNAICFSYLLMSYPDDVIDYVVLHEIAHIKHHNHSKAFWKYIEGFMPDYKERRQRLK